MDTDAADHDLYADLGIEPDASAAEITAAYRRLVRDLHPDTNPDPAAGERFQQVTAAYDVLRNPQQRAAYDRTRRSPSRSRRRPGGGYTIRVDNLDHNDGFLFGPAPPGSFLDDVHRTSPFSHAASPPRERDLVAEVTVAFREAVFGTSRPVPVSGRGTVTVKIPPGTDEGDTMRIPATGAGRDVVVTVHVEPHHLFGLLGPNLTLTVPVTYAEAVLGTDITVPTLDGDPVTVRLAPGTPTEQTLRVRGRGVPTASARGDLLVTIHVEVPRTVTDRHADLIRRLAPHDPSDIRDHLHTSRATREGGER